MKTGLLKKRGNARKFDLPRQHFSGEYYLKNPRPVPYFFFTFEINKEETCRPK